MFSCSLRYENDNLNLKTVLSSSVVPSTNQVIVDRDMRAALTYGCLELFRAWIAALQKLEECQLIAIRVFDSELPKTPRLIFNRFFNHLTSLALDSIMQHVQLLCTQCDICRPWFDLTIRFEEVDIGCCFVPCKD